VSKDVSHMLYTDVLHDSLKVTRLYVYGDDIPNWNITYQIELLCQRKYVLR